MSDGPVVNERIARRRAEVRSARRRRRLRRTLAVLGVVALVLGLVALERSSLVALAELEVVGTERLTRDEVVAAAEVEPGMSVLRIRLGRVEERVAAMPLVDSVVVERSGALGLTITVRESEPALTAQYPSGALLVSANGQVLGPGEAPGTTTVQLTGRPPEPGSAVDADPALAAAHDVLLGLPGPLAALVTGARAPAADAVELDLASGLVVRWGGPGRNDEKARALGAVLEDLGDREVTAIDVRAPAAPTVVP